MRNEEKQTSTEPLSAPSILGISVWFGLLTGLLEVAARMLQLKLFGVRIWLSADLVWMTPLADVVIFSLIGLVLAVLYRLLPRLVTPTVVLAVLFLAALAGPLLHMARIHQVASLVLAVGVAVQAARMLVRYLPKVRVLAPRTGLAMVLIVVAMAAWVRGSAWMEERRSVASLGEPEAGVPNVLLIILDTVRAKSLGLYGYERPTTPNIERIAGGGVTFDQAWTTSPWTLPSHGTMFTGYRPHELSTTLLTPLDDTYPTLAEEFAERGYLTGGFVGNLLFTTRESGLDRGFAHYSDYPTSPGMVIASSWLARLIKNGLGSYAKLKSKHAALINHQFLTWLDRQDADRPFFVFLNYMDVHAPYLPPEPYDKLFGPAREGPPEADPSEREHWTSAEIAAEQAAYDGAMAYLDAQLGALFEQLGERGALDNTLIIITSDHGEQFGEHGLMDHGNSLYRPLLRAPLVFVWPGRIPAGLRVMTPVSLRDLSSTIASLAWSEQGLFPGVSLAGQWGEPTSEGVVPSPVLSEVKAGVRPSPWLPLARGPMHSVVIDGHHYIRNGDGVEELYDLEADPEELHDLSSLPESQPVLTKARSMVPPPAADTE